METNVEMSKSNSKIYPSTAQNSATAFRVGKRTKAH